MVHRAIYETFVCEIPEGYEIDHINTIRDDNRIENLRCVTPKENSNNILSKKHKSEAMIGNTNARANTNNRGKTRSEFGKKFKEHFGIDCCENTKLYYKERMWYRTHNNTCRWEN